LSVINLAKRKVSRVRRYFKKRRSSVKDKRVPILTALGAISGAIMAPSTSGGGVPPYKAIMDGNYQWAMEGLLENYTGYNMYTKTWNPLNAHGLMLTIVGGLGSKAATAVGANRALRKVPLVGKYIKL
jgi:hypothetical protein